MNDFRAGFGAPASPDEERGWRVGHEGRDQMYYEELRDGAWERIEIDGEMLMGRAHHVIYFATPERWQHHPPWARERRGEIIARIRSEFRAPDYEYHGEAAPGAPSVSATADPPPPPPAPPASPGTGTSRAALPSRGMLALWVAVALLLVLAAWMAWLVTDGIVHGETFYPAKRAFLRRMLSRLQEPAMFWLSIGVQSAIGLGALILALLGIREGVKISRGGRASPDDRHR